MLLVHYPRSLALALCISAGLHAFCQEPAYMPGDLLVMLRPGASIEQVVSDLAVVDGRATGVHSVREVSAPMRTWLLHFNDALVPQAVMLRAARQDRHVAIAQNDHLVKDRATPNDPQFGQQWQHVNIHSEDAWDLTTGGVTAAGDTVVVCIVENADLSHPDLAGNAWYNRNEIPGNGLDDDGNGYVDDYRGWDPFNNNDNVYSGPHGTEVAGMIGAKGDNGNQVVGANWDVKMMVVARSGVAEDAVIEAYTYPLVMRRAYNSSNGALGAFVVATNASWGIDNGQPADAPLWCAMYDTLGAAGILNCGATANNNVNIDQVGDLPTACASDFMISVTATNAQDVRTFSGFGATTIDVGAPGDQIFTTQIGGGTGSASGTSFASPLTAGVIGLLYSAPCASLMQLVHADPQQGALYVRQALFNGVDQVGNLPGQTVTGGRINSANSLQWIMQNCGACPGPFALTATTNGLDAATLQWNNTATDVFNVRYRAVGSPDWTTVNDVHATSLDIQGLEACTAYEFQVEADCDSTTSDFGSSYLFTSGGCCTPPNDVQAMATDSAHATVTWSTVLVADHYDLRYAPTGTNAWTEIDGAGQGTSLEGLQPCSEYEVQLRSTCADNTTDWGPSTVFHTPGCGLCVDNTFCPSQSADATSEWIARVQVAGIDHQSGSDGGYAANTDAGTVLVIGHAYPITLTPGFQGFTFGEYFTAWIDLDGDGLFSAPQERVFDAGMASNSAVSGTLTVPADAMPISTRLRIVMQYDSAVSNGCMTNYPYGETEDYCVTLQVAQGVHPLARTAVRLFPDPTDATLFCDLPQDAKGGIRLEITDATGRMVKTTRLFAGRNDVSTAELANGTYLYRLVDGSGVMDAGRLEVLHP